MKFGHQVRDALRHIYTITIHKLMSVEGEIIFAHRQWTGGSNPFSFSLTLGNLSRATREKAWGILGIARDSPYCENHFCIICLCFGQDLLDYRDKLLYWDHAIVCKG